VTPLYRAEAKELGRETGVTIDWLNAWSHAGLNFGVSADSMQESLNHLTSQMPQFRNHIGELYGLLSQKWPNLTQRLLGENTGTGIVVRAQAKSILQPVRIAVRERSCGGQGARRGTPTRWRA
jgi:hypothetical protein